MIKRKLLVVMFIMFAMVVVLTGCGKNGAKEYEKPLEYYFKGIEERNANTYKKAFPKFIEESDSEENVEYIGSMFEDQYGEDYKITYKVTNDEKLKNEDLESVTSCIEKQYNENVDISGGYELTVEITINGEDDSYTTTTEMYVYKINNDWCYIDLSPDNARTQLD